MDIQAIDPVIIPVVAILMPLVLVPTIIILKHRHCRREWEHKERMKAMEIGSRPHQSVARQRGRDRRHRRGRPDRLCVRALSGQHLDRRGHTSEDSMPSTASPGAAPS